MKVDQATKKRFAANVVKNPSGCWNWTGSKTRGGYGKFSDKGKQARAHKWLCELVTGRVKKGFDVHHTCGNRVCVNPRHLRVLSHSENMHEAARRGAWAGEKNSNAKLTEGEVHLIRVLHDLGESVEEIAGRYPVNKREIYNVISRRSWRHIDFPDPLPPVNVKEVILDLLPTLEGLYQLRVERNQPLPPRFADLCKNCAAILGR